eukprot:XP_010648123.1 PREDICTED: extensin-like [Vitis vinifera]
MVKTRGGLSASPSSPTPRPQRVAMGAAPSPPVQAPAIPPSEGEVPSQRRYPTRRPPTEPVPPAEQAASSVSRPPAKMTRFSGPGEPSHAPQPEPATEEPRIPVDMPPEAIIRRPMIAGPPIEAIDYFTKWTKVASYANLIAAKVAKFIRSHIICRYGIPHELISDRGVHFRGEVDTLVQEYGIQHHRLSAYRP